MIEEDDHPLLVLEYKGVHHLHVRLLVNRLINTRSDIILNSGSHVVSEINQ